MANKVVVVGSLHYDVMVQAPDRPRKGETVLGHAWWPKCGGKGGNQAVEASLSGATVEMVGAVGDDDFGRRLLDNLHRTGVGTDAVAVIPGAGSGMSVAILDAGGDYGAVVVSGANRRIVVSDDVAVGWQAGDILVLQNEIPADTNLAAARLAKARGMRVLLNAAPALALDAEFLDLVDVLVVNAVEAEMLGAGIVDGLGGASLAASRLVRGTGTAIVTAGGAGVAFAGSDGAGSVAAVPVRLVSTHGAGDCFVGVLAARLVNGDSISDAVSVANTAAGKLVSMSDDERAARQSPKIR